MEESIKINPIVREEALVMKDIKCGLYRDHYLVYNRKSTDEPENQKNSLSYQRSENLRYAKIKELAIAPITIKGFCTEGVISEKHSGFKENIELIFSNDNTVKYKIKRPKFYQLVQFLSKGYFRGIIFLCWDRASRNKGDDTIIRKLMKQGIDFKFALANYDKSSSGALHMDIDGMFAEHHSRVTSEKVTLTIKNKRNQGIVTHKAPVGYLNLGKMEDKPIDPIRGPVIKELFEKYSSGDWTLSELARYCINIGFTMPASRRRRTEEEMLTEEEDDTSINITPINRLPRFQNISKILTNRFYIGETLDGEGNYIKSNSHKALVTEEVFNRVQIMLKRKKVSIHYVKRLKLPFRGLIRCDECKRVYTPYTQKGYLYLGCKCTPGCSNKSKNISILSFLKQTEEFIKHLWFTDDELEELNARAHTDISLFEIKRTAILEEYERSKKKIREDQAYLVKNKVALLRTGAFTPESIRKEEESLKYELSKLKLEEDISDVSMFATLHDVTKLSELLKFVYLYYELTKIEEKENIIKQIFSEFYISNNELKFITKNGFSVLESRFLRPGDLTLWLFEASKNNKLIKFNIETLKEILEAKDQICIAA